MSDRPPVDILADAQVLGRLRRLLAMCETDGGGIEPLLLHTQGAVGMYAAIRDAATVLERHAAPDTSVTILGHAGRLDVIGLQPNDVIVISVHDRLTDNERRWLETYIGETFPTHPVLTLDRGVTLAAAVRPTSEANACICAPVDGGIDLDPACPSHGIGARL